MQHPVWSGHIAFGFLCIPIKLCAAARSERISFHLVYPIEAPSDAKAAAATGAAPSNVLQFPGEKDSTALPLPKRVARVRRAWVREDGTIIPEEDLLLAWEFEAGEYAVLRKSELQELKPPQTKEIQILECVEPREVDVKFYAESYDVWPGMGGERGYEALYFALADNGFVGIAHQPLSRRDRLVAIRPGRHGLVLHRLYFPEDVNFDNEYHMEPGRISAQERNAAAAFARSLKQEWEPEKKYTNQFQDHVLEFLVNRCRSGSASSGDYRKRRPAQVVNIEEEMRRSIEMLRRPPQPERDGSGSRKKRKRPRA